MELFSDNLPQTANRIRNANGKAILLIGSRGSQFLFGHQPQLFIEKLALGNNQEIVDNTRRTQKNLNTLFTKAKISWQNMRNEEKMRYLFEFCGTNQPNNDVISCLIELLENRLFGAVVVTDPSRVLASRLNHSFIEFSCASINPGAINIYANEFDLLKTSFVIDGSDLLFDFSPGYLGNKISEPMRTFISKYNLVVIWGWEQYNIKLAKITNNDRFILLGEENLHAIDDFISEDGGKKCYQLNSAGQEQNAIIDIYKELHLGAIPNSPMVNINIKPSSFSVTTQPAIMPCLLWDEASWKDLVSDLEKFKLTVVGVDGPVVRQRLIHAVSAQLPSNQIRRFWVDFRDLMGYIKYFAPQKFKTYIIAELKEKLLREETYVANFTNCVKLLENGNAYVFLFTNISVLDSAKKLPASSLNHRGLDSKFLSKEVLYHWFLKRIPNGAIVSQEQKAYDDGMQKLVTIVHNSITLEKEASVDRLHETLDVWYSQIGRLITDNSIGNPTITMEDCLRVWNDVKLLLGDNQALADFEIAIKPKDLKGSPDGAALTEPKEEQDDIAAVENDDDGFQITVKSRERGE
jgi:hypothetical protein